MAKKTPGKLTPPPAQEAFDKLPLSGWCAAVRGVFYRLHSTNRETGKPWPPVSFSRRGQTRFDPVEGLGTLCLGETLSGVLMEIFDDRWGPVGDISRSLTETELQEWWVTLVSVPATKALEAHRTNLSKLGTDLQLIAGDHKIARQWALRVMCHPAGALGIRYPSRHDESRRNLALFQHTNLLPAKFDGNLHPPAAACGLAAARDNGPLIYGPAVLLQDHPELAPSMAELEIALLP